MEEQDRRHYPRLRAPVLCRPAGYRLAGTGETLDISLGGARIYSDEFTPAGTPLELELILPDGDSAVCRAEVAWIETLPEGSPAKFDVGLRFTQLSAAVRARLGRVLAVEP